KININTFDSATPLLDGTGVGSSRSMVSGGGAVLLACQELRSRIMKDGAILFNADISEIVMGEYGIYLESSDQFLSYADLISAGETGRYAITKRHAPTRLLFSYSTHACIASVNLSTG